MRTTTHSSTHSYASAQQSPFRNGINIHQHTQHFWSVECLPIFGYSSWISPRNPFIQYVLLSFSPFPSLSPSRAPHSWFFVYSRVRLNSARSFYLIFAKLDTVDIAAELDRCEANETVPSGIDYNVNIFRVVMKKCQESNGEMPIYIYSALCSCGWEQQCVRTLCEMRTNNSPTYRRQNEVSSRKNVRASRSIRNFFI